MSAPLFRLRGRLHVVVDAGGTLGLINGAEHLALEKVAPYPRICRRLLGQLVTWIETSRRRWPDTHPVVRAVRWAMDLLRDWLIWAQPAPAAKGLAR